VRHRFYFKRVKQGKSPFSEITYCVKVSRYGSMYDMKKEPLRPLVLIPDGPEVPTVVGPELSAVQERMGEKAIAMIDESKRILGQIRPMIDEVHALQSCARSIFQELKSQLGVTCFDEVLKDHDQAP